MSKTYVINSTSVVGYRYNSTNSGIINASNFTTESGERYFGKASGNTYYYAVRLNFATDDMQHCYDLYASNTSNITSITLTLNHNSTSYAKNWHAGATTVSTGTKTSTTSYIAIPKSATQTVADITSFGISSQLAYTVGKTTDSSQIRLTAGASHSIVIVTAENDYTLTYSANGGSGAPSSQTATGVGSAEFTVNTGTPTRSGYTFLGWSKSSSASTATYSAGDSITITANTTLYAVWRAVTYTITFNANGGSGGPSTQTKTHGSTLTLTTDKPSLTGHTFSSWNTAQDGSGTTYASGGSFTVNAATTLYAQWTANQYTITFDCNGGTQCASKTVTFNQAIGQLPTCTRTGYSFGQWKYNGATVTQATVYTYAQDITLTATWTANTYTVEYTDGENTIERTITYDTPWTVESALFGKTGHTQTSWETDAGYTKSFGSSQNSWYNMTLYAVFTPNTYTITFDSNGGSSVSSKQVTYGTAVGTLARPTYDRHIFLGWKYGTSTDYWTASKIYDIASNVTLVAQWEEEQNNYTSASIYVKTADGNIHTARIGKYLGNNTFKYGDAYVNTES